MQATLTDLHRRTSEVVRPVIRDGAEVVLTDFGRPVARLVPYLATVVCRTADEARRGVLTDESIREAVAEANDGPASEVQP